ncbi:hypothetical protein [Micromonospora fulviviridis]|uniref:MFS transporter n=1 Tax=Micromonospora fulviviridis TaxID=47860 RepID=A0ABV2VMW8_9ACTN
MVAALAVTSTVGYGTLYYAYAVLLRPMAVTLGASATAMTGAAWPVSPRPPCSPTATAPSPTPASPRR